MTGPLMPGSILSMPAAAAERLIRLDSGDAALLYLYLLGHGNAAGLNWPRERLQGALDLLSAQGMAGAEAAPPPPAPPVQEALPPEYTTQDVTAALQEAGSTFSALADEVERRLGKRLSANDLKILLTLYDHLALPGEVILMLVTWCIEETERKYGPGRRPFLSQVRKEGFAWSRQGIDTVEAAEAHLKKLAQLRTREREVLRLLDIPARPLVERERTYIAAWQDMGFDNEALRLAYEKTVMKKQSMDWGYMNGILRRWHEKGLHTVAAIQAGDGLRRNRGGAPAQGRTPQPGEERRVREDMERMRRLMEQMKREEMSYDPAVLRRATARLEGERRAREERQQALRRAACQRQPRLSEIDRQLRGTMTELFAASLRRGEGGAPTVEEVRRKNLALQQERAELLVRMDLAEDALDDKPACPLCGDTGWRGTEMCRCLRALCAQEQIRELSKLLDLGEQSFDTFRMDYYSTSFWPEWGTSPRENMELVYEVCLNYAQKFGRFYFKNLFLSGAPGLGKTFLSACIARTVSENGHSVVYDTAGNVFAQFEARKFLRDSDDGREARDETRRYLGCDLLILDDLGSELTTQFTQSALYELINGRLVGGKRTVISSNLSMEEAAVRYSPQIASRLEGEYHLLHFFGEDIRLLRKKQL